MKNLPKKFFFEKRLLEDKSTTKIFHWSRSAHCLLSQWQLLFKYNLLSGQVIPHPSQSEHHQDVTSSYDDRELNIETEAETHSRWNRRKILKLEKEILTLESFINDTNCCATINGDFTHYEISSDQSIIIIGRGKESDCDLANEINASRIHRRQAEIRICHQKNEYPTFIIRNIGHRVVSVNGLQLLMDDEVELHHDSLIQAKIRVASASAETIQMTMYRRLKLSTTKAKLFSINTYIHKQARELQPEGDETEQAGHGREHAVATMQSKAAKGDIGGRQVR